MKVTVCFGPTKVVVPCGGGDISVRDLAVEAVERYKKAGRKSPQCRVRIHALKSFSDGGILDPDDKLCDVVDDKEQILAIFDESGEGKDDVNGNITTTTEERRWGGGAIYRPHVSPSFGSDEHSVEITSLDYPPRSGLLVVAHDPLHVNGTASTSWQGGGTSITVNGPSSTLLEPSESRSVSFQPEPLRSSNKSWGGKGFVRGGGARQSSLANFTEPPFDAQVPSSSKSSPELLARAPSPVSSVSQRKNPTAITVSVPGTRKSAKPLGILIEPVYADPEKKRLKGMAVTQISEDGRAAQSGGLKLHDLITEIGERPVYQMSKVRAQSYIHEAENSSEAVEFKVLREGGEVETAKENTSPSHPTVTPQSALQKANTKKIGQKLLIELKKGSSGLGFTVTSRDTVVAKERPFYIKTVLPRGAAIDDGRLQAGDRLLEVNGRDVTGLQQKEVVEMLRNIKEGETAKLIMSRIGEVSEDQPDSNLRTPPPPAKRAGTVSPPPVGSPLPRPLPSSGSTPPLPRKLPLPLHQLRLNIPLNSTGSAGLGISVKGRTTEGTQVDCGIFIKSIMHGGAAHKDGRLRVNDQLIAVNDTSLEGFSNEQSLDVLRDAMRRLDPSANSILLTVLRVQNHQDPSPQRYPVQSGDFYSCIMKSPTLQSSSESGVIIIEDDNDAVHEQSMNLYEEVDTNSVSELPAGEDPFNRENALRQSMSEKRHMGAQNNPGHSMTYQKIKHSRQTSDDKERRSMSLESLNHVAAPEPPPPLMVHEFALQGSFRGSGRHPKEQKRLNAAKKANRLRPTNDSFRNAVDRSYQSMPGAEVGVDVGRKKESGNSGNGNNPLRHSLPRDAKSSERRKSSSGTSLFSRLRLSSSHSREASPDKKKAAQHEKEAQERAKRAAQEEQLRIREQYEKLKRQQEEELKRMRVPSPHWVRPPPYYHNGPPAAFLRAPYYPPPTSSHQQHPIYYRQPPREPSPFRDYEEPPWTSNIPTSTAPEPFYRSLDRREGSTLTGRGVEVPPRWWANGAAEAGARVGPPSSTPAGTSPHTSSSTAGTSRTFNTPPPPARAPRRLRPASNFFDYSSRDLNLRQTFFVSEEEDGSREIRTFPEQEFVIRM